jgi:neutral ceramidase
MSYRIGIGKADITGPSVGLAFMGMSNPLQTGRGIHSRLFSRAFVVEDRDTQKFLAIVVPDLGLCSLAVKLAVASRLKGDLAFRVNGHGAFDESNVLITATHTHSGPGGYSDYLIYNAAMRGFSPKNFECIVQGIVQSIRAAFINRQEGRIFMSRGDVEDCGKIRSMPAYLKNAPELQGADPEDDTPLYREMTLLKFVPNRGPIGVLSWYGVHPTCMGEKGRLISGDNKSYAQSLFESRPGITAAFANSCCGDISPNAGRGLPDGLHDFDRTVEFGLKQSQKASDLSLDESLELVGGLDYRHRYVDLSCWPAGTQGSPLRKTWPPALGFGMIRGSSEDSEGLRCITNWGEGTTRENISHDPDEFRRVIKFATTLFFGVEWPEPLPREYVEGHGNKAILLPLGLCDYHGFPLAPTVLPLQVIRLGSLGIVAHPGEMTTVAGMRLRKKVLDILGKGGRVAHVVIAAYANAFSSYCTTPEEYHEQHYEGASTLFGPESLTAYIEEDCRLALELRNSTIPDPGPPPPRPSGAQLKKIADRIIPDGLIPGLDLTFGSVEEDARPAYQRGQTVSVTFLGAYPNNDLKLGGSYVSVERQENGVWAPAYGDNDFCTRMLWSPDGTASRIKVEWTISSKETTGQYRIGYFGDRLLFPPALVPIMGYSRTFVVT